jgi:hypothetical protein
VKDEAVAVGRDDEGNAQSLGVLQALLDSVADAVVVVLGLDDCHGDVRLVVEDVIGASASAAGNELPSDDDAALGEADLLADLRQLIPARRLERRGDEFGADVALAEERLVHDSLTLLAVSPGPFEP